MATHASSATWNDVPSARRWDAETERSDSHLSGPLGTEGVQVVAHGAEHGRRAAAGGRADGVRHQPPQRPPPRRLDLLHLSSWTSSFDVGLLYDLTLTQDLTPSVFGLSPNLT